MRIAALVALTLALDACAHVSSADADLRRVVRDELATRRVCLALPSGGQIGRSEDVVSLYANRDDAGGYRFDEDTRRAFDAFVAIGFFSVDERAVDGTPRVRRYRVTPAGEPYYEPVVPEPAGSRWGGFCYGTQVLVGVDWVSPVVRAPCSISRGVRLRYRHAGFPAWVDDPRIAAAFPHRLGQRQMDVVRSGRMTLVPDGDSWRLGGSDGPHPNCVVVP